MYRCKRCKSMIFMIYDHCYNESVSLLTRIKQKSVIYVEEKQCCFSFPTSLLVIPDFCCANREYFATLNHNMNSLVHSKFLIQNYPWAWCTLYPITLAVRKLWPIMMYHRSRAISLFRVSAGNFPTKALKSSLLQFFPGVNKFGLCIQTCNLSMVDVQT